MPVHRAKALKLWGISAIFAVWLAYANSFENPFEFDDFHTITDNPAVRSLTNVPRFFTDATAFSVLPANRTYRPLVSLSLAVDYAMGRGYDPFWFHVSTFCWFLVLLYTVWLLYAKLMDATEASSTNLWLAMFAAAWFGLHPAIAETVNYVIQRGDLYCTLGCVAALAVYARRPDWRRFGVYLLPLAAALLSKPPAAVFPALLLLYVFYFEAGGLSLGKRWRTAFAAAMPALLVTAALMLLQSQMTPKTFAPSMISPADYRLVQPLVWLRYFGELFLPVHLNVDTDLQARGALDAATLAGLAFGVLLGVAIGWASRRKRRYPVAFGLAWFLVTQLPTSLYPLSEVENDHRMFFSFVGLILAVVWAARLGYERLPLLQAGLLRPVLVGGAILLLSGYAWGVHVRNQVWHSQESLWLDDVRKSPHNGRGLMIYGLTLLNRGEYASANDTFMRALAFTPNYATLELNLGVVNGAMGRTAEAETHFKRAIALTPQDDQPHAFYARWLHQQGRTAEAITEARTAVALNPARAMQHDVLLQALSRSGDVTAVKQAAVETLAAVPGDATATAMLVDPGVEAVPVAASAAVNAAGYVNLSLALCQQQKFEDCLVAAKQALRIDPQSAEAWNNIAAANEAMKRWDAAIDAAKKAVALKPDFQLAKNNLAWSMSQKAAGK